MNNNPSDNRDTSRIEALLRSIRPVPGDEFNRRMASAPWNSAVERKGRSFHLGHNFRLASIIACIIVLVGLIFTPAGRALAKEIIHFFNHIVGTSFPLPEDQIVQPVPTGTPQPTYYPALLPSDRLTETESMPEATPSPTPVLNLDLLQDTDSTTARSLVDFQLLEPSSLPEDYRLTNIRYDDGQKALLFTYAPKSTEGGGHFVLIQGRNLTSLQNPADAHWEMVRTGGNAIEWVDAPHLFADGAAAVLTWEQAGVPRRIEIFTDGNGSTAGLNREDWLAVVAGLTTCPADRSAEDYACQVNHAAVAAGFVPWQFSRVPDGYAFESVYYKAGMTAVWFSSPAGELGVLQSIDDFKTQESNDWFSVPQDAIQEVIVAGQPAEYVNGSFTANPGEDHAVWNPDSGQIRLRWKQADYWFQFVKWGAPAMQPQELADLASTLTSNAPKGNAVAQATPPSSSQSQLYLTIADAEKAYGKKFLQPSVLPDGMPFSHARLYDDDAITLFYGGFGEDKLEMTGRMLMLSQEGHGQSFADIYKAYPSEAVTRVEVNGQPAYLIRGAMLVASYDASGNSLIDEPVWQQDPFCLSLTWQKDDVDYFLQFATISGSGARITDKSLIEIAESLR